MASQGQQKFEKFRKEYPFLAYEGFSSHLDPDGLHVSYHFNLSDKIHFHPGFHLPFKPGNRKNLLNYFPDSEEARNLLFHIGMIELISYWKAACPPLVIVKGYLLNDSQVRFWKKTFFLGLGEFFYTNSIKSDEDSFLTLKSEGEILKPFVPDTSETVMVPVGGGKDSVVTLELLRTDFQVVPFILNPRGASLETCNKAGFSGPRIAEIHRRLDPRLLQMNEEGFLNGHTPFSALLAFYTLLAAFVHGTKHIALSNESSANEPTVPGSDVNHQYSKSFEFEKDFREYYQQTISGELNYFSFLRPLSELQIAMLFSRFVKYYPVFKSCNAGSKTDSWCGNCPKCLFAWTILSPFIPQNELAHIFGKNLFDDSGMIRYLKELTGLEDVKPFECVGTIDEVNAALQLYIRHHNREKWPLLIDYYSNTSAFSQFRNTEEEAVLKTFNKEHFLKDSFLTILMEVIG